MAVEFLDARKKFLNLGFAEVDVSGTVEQIATLEQTFLNSLKFRERQLMV